MFKIEQGIEMPKEKGIRKDTLTWALKNIKVGESFELYNHQSGTARTIATRLKIKVSIIKMNSEYSRLWRTE